MLCSNCHKNEATVHLTTIVGEQSETLDLCKDCAPGGPSYYPSNPKELQKLSIVGKTCDICGRPAISGEMNAAGSATYWCLECGVEISRIMSESLASARPDWVQKIKDTASWLGFVRDAELQAWAQAATANAISILKERKGRREGDPSS